MRIVVENVERIFRETDPVSNMTGRRR